MKKVYILVALLSLILQFLAPNLCGGFGEAEGYVALFVAITIPLRLWFANPSYTDNVIYLVTLLTSFIWIKLYLILILYVKHNWINFS